MCYYCGAHRNKSQVFVFLHALRDKSQTSTHPLTLPSTPPSEALLAFPPLPPWNLHSFTVESIPLHAPALIPLSRQDAAPAHLTIWYSEQAALFLFLLTKAALAYLPTAFSVALRPLFPSQQAQYAQVFLLKPAPFCKLCWSRQHQQVCHFSSPI